MSIWDIGDQASLGNHSASGAEAFTNRAGVITDPSVVALRIKKPNGTTLVYQWPTPGLSGSLQKEITGRFYADITFDIPGVWKCRLEGTGALVATTEWTETVKRSLVL